MDWLTKLFNWIAMKFKDILNYNRKSAEDNGWDPSWFGTTSFDSELVKQVKIFQNQHNLEVDGMVGPATFRRIETKRESEVVEEEVAVAEDRDLVEHIVCNGEKVAIDWHAVVTMEEKGALVLPENCYREQKKERKPSLIVTHWDAALSASSCHRILKKRKISSHFVIDNDGTIYQLMDTNHIAWHAKGVNNISIGVDFSNAYYPKYQKWYTKKGFGRRPVLDDSVTHGYKHKPHLGYYKVQLNAYKALLKALCDHYDIPKSCPTDDVSKKLITDVFKPAKDGMYEGVVCHYHLARKKIDCAGLKLDEIIKELNES